MHEVLVNRLGGLRLPSKSVFRLKPSRHDLLDVYRGRKTTTQQLDCIFQNIQKIVISIKLCVFTELLIGPLLYTVRSRGSVVGYVLACRPRLKDIISQND